MKTIVQKFEITEKTSLTEVQKNLVDLGAELFLNLPLGKYQLSITKPKRTPAQNRTIHLIFGKIAEELRTHGLGEKKLTIKAYPTEENLKIFFREKFLNGKKTSETKTDELAKALDLFLDSFNEFFREKNLPIVRIDSAELRSLLNSS